MICLTHLLLGIVLKLLVLSRIFAERIFEDCIDLVELLDTFGCMIVYLFLSARNVLRDIYAKTYKITSKTTSVYGVRWCTVYNDDTSLRMRPEQFAQPIAFFLTSTWLAFPSQLPCWSLLGGNHCLLAQP